jgi:hypothetical protein
VIWFISQLMDVAAESAQDEAKDLEKNPRPFFIEPVQSSAKQGLTGA